MNNILFCIPGYHRTLGTCISSSSSRQRKIFDVRVYVYVCLHTLKEPVNMEGLRGFS